MITDSTDTFFCVCVFSTKLLPIHTHGVNVPFDQVVFLWLQHQVIASERDNARLPAAARYLRQSVRVEASAGQHVATSHLITLEE